MVKAIQIGLGAWGFSWSKDVIPKVPNVEMVGFVDTNPDAAARVQTELGIDPKLCFTSLDDAASRAGASLALCTLRTEAHYPVVKRCLELGYHVLVEKPFTTTIAQGKELVALAKAQGKLLMVSQNYRHQPAPIAAANLVASGKFGPMSMVSVDFRRHGPTQGYRYWDMPDPLLADMSIHHFDLMRFVLGDEPKRLSARTWNPPGSPFQFDPTGVVTIEFARGTVVTYRASWMSAQPVTPWAGEWVMDGAEGVISWSSRDHFRDQRGPDRLGLRVLDGPEEAVPLDTIEFADRVGTLHTMARVIETGVQPVGFSSGEDNLGSLAMVQASILSASRGGDWVETAEVIG
ncbi:MAG: Gfo/Idh/MocA family oxidoreductase [Phyllobacteriaceae bacterium]|nr:Gfo/Idh/MocA family oxidoreductase [Phyllobacteriaceae bacterium]